MWMSGLECNVVYVCVCDAAFVHSTHDWGDFWDQHQGLACAGPKLQLKSHVLRMTPHRTSHCSFGTPIA